MRQTLGRNIHFEVHARFRKIRVSNCVSQRPGTSPFSCSIFLSLGVRLKLGDG